MIYTTNAAQAAAASGRLWLVGLIIALAIAVGVCIWMEVVAPALAEVRASRELRDEWDDAEWEAFDNVRSITGPYDQDLDGAA